MKKQKEYFTEIAILRQKAEKKLEMEGKKDKQFFHEADMLRLVHELEVHQIELEMQNEELKSAIEKAEMEKQKYTELYDFAPSGYLTLSKEGYITELNFATCYILNKDRSQLINRSFAFFVSANTRSVFKQFIKNVFTSKVKHGCEIVIDVKDKSPEDIKIYGVADKNKNFCLLTLINISKIKHAEMNLLEAKRIAEEQANNYKSLFNSIRDAILVSDTDWNITDCNSAFCSLFGYSKEDIIGKKTLYAYENEAQFIELGHAINVNQDGNPIIYTVNYKKKNGDIFPGETGVYSLKNNQGTVLGFIGLIRDITERK